MRQNELGAQQRIEKRTFTTRIQPNVRNSKD